MREDERATIVPADNSVYFSGKRCKSKEEKNCSGKSWSWMRRPYSRERCMKSYIETASLARKGHEPYKTCLQRIHNLTGAPKRLLRGYADIYYIPASKMKEFVAVASVFYKHGSFVEVAIPSVILCICSEQEVRRFFGIEQTGKRLLPWINIWRIYNDTRLVFYHATKWTGVLKNDSRYRQVYQDAYSKIHRCKKKKT